MKPKALWGRLERPFSQGFLAVADGSEEEYRGARGAYFLAEILNLLAEFKLFSAIRILPNCIKIIVIRQIRSKKYPQIYHIDSFAGVYLRAAGKIKLIIELK